MADETAPWQMVEYEGFEIHVAPFPKNPPDETKPSAVPDNRCTYVGYVCHPGADPSIPGHAVPFHPGGTAPPARGWTGPRPEGTRNRHTWRGYHARPRASVPLAGFFEKGPREFRYPRNS